MATHPNGQWPRGELAVIPGGTKMGGSALVRRELLPSIVAMQSACYRDTGLALRPTSAADGYRDLATQERTFNGRYRLQATGEGPFSDVRRYQGRRYVRVSPAGSAAVPGTSNHGDAEAVDWADMTGPLLTWMRARAIAFGWANPLWARDSNPRNGSLEPWHWEPEDDAFAVHRWVDMIGRPDLLNPGGTLPNPIEEDPLAGITLQDIEDVVASRVQHVLGEHIAAISTNTSQLVALYPVDRKGPGSTTLVQEVADANTNAQAAVAQIAGLTAAVNALAAREGLDPDAILTAAQQGAARALEQAKFTVTTTQNGA